MTRIFSFKQKVGHGTIMYEKLEKFLKSESVNEIRLNSYKSSHSFWIKMGFKDDKRFDNRGMVKKLR